MKFYKKIYLHGKFITEFHFFFSLSRMFHWMNKFLITENRKAVKVFELYLPKFLSLEYVKYKNPPTECRQRINYAID